MRTQASGRSAELSSPLSSEGKVGHAGKEQFDVARSGVARTRRSRFLSPSSRLVGAMVLLAVVAVGVSGRQPGFVSTTRDSSASPTATSFGFAESTSQQGGSGSLETGGALAPTSGGTPAPGSAGALAPTSSGALAPTSGPRPTARSVACTPTDQDRYVYNPSRLEVGEACTHVSGTVQAVRREADGDLHILVALDSPYAFLLRPANQGVELGDLVVEPVCVRTVTQVDAVGVCASDPDPLAPPYPAVGQHVWMEGRYVFDLDHGGWAELHPLYRWGIG